MRVLAFLVAVLSGCAFLPEPVQEDAAPQPRDLSVEPHLLGEPPTGKASYGAAVALDFGHQVSFYGACDGLCAASVQPLPDGRPDAWLEVKVPWDGREHSGFSLHVEGPDGSVVAEGRRGFDTVRATVWRLEEGPYRVVIEGEGELQGTIRLRAVDLPTSAEEHLPNLVTLTPLELAVGQCKIEESVEEGAVRCLRLGNAVGNVGDGPLEVHLDHANAALSAAGLGQFVQRIYGPSGHRDVPASAAEFHFTHGHFHYAGLAHFELHPVEDGLRGDMVAIGHKRGFCFLDWGEMETPEAPPEREQHAEQNCLLPAMDSGWSMGISRGWYDYYWSDLADQYIDIEGVPDGTYELVSVADGADTLLETDETDNKASVIIQLTGDQVRVLEERSLYDNPEAG